MRKIITYKNINTEFFKRNILYWAQSFSHVAYLESNAEYNKQTDNSFTNYHTIVAIDKISELQYHDKKDNFLRLKEYYETLKDWLFGFFTYDLKNEIENLTSENFDGVQMPEINFFQPKLIFFIANNIIKVEYFNDYTPRVFVENMVKQIKNFHLPTETEINLTMQSRINKDQYVEIINQIKEHIKRGDIYEMNYCFEFFAENVYISPATVFYQLNKISPMPFSCFYKLYDKSLISASPERFLLKKERQIISQPIKGTIKRGETPEQDQINRNLLLNNPKERSENVMIVDLVRNDLSKNAEQGSVKVLELFGIYSFSTLHQMISTIGCTIANGSHFVDTIRDCFPMGSMTGAPKVRAMELIEKYELTKRGLYSGAVGYITAYANFDFNVVIRSLLYNRQRKYLSYMVGSAITSESIAEQEYEECLLKAKTMKNLFQK